MYIFFSFASPPFPLIPAASFGCERRQMLRFNLFALSSSSVSLKNRKKK